MKEKKVVLHTQVTQKNPTHPQPPGQADQLAPGGWVGSTYNFYSGDILLFLAMGVFFPQKISIRLTAYYFILFLSQK